MQEARIMVLARLMQSSKELCIFRQKTFLIEEGGEKAWQEEWRVYI